MAASLPQVNLGYATYQGVRLAAGVDQYLGMRYAEPPLGALRWRAPEDPTPIAAVQNARKFGPICLGVSRIKNLTAAEDCLFVNVFTPSNASDESNLLPVWVYIQGGGFGVNANANYNGTEIIKTSGYNLVFVNFNYRVGALGFLASENIRQNGDLNVGLLDQRKLLNWVQKHISKFGGDPNHVVLHGASAGAGSLAHHLTAYGGRNDNLFVGTVVESTFWPTLRTVSQMEFQYDRFVHTTGCSDTQDPLACMRSLDTDLIQTGDFDLPFPGGSATPVPLWYFLPVVDGDLIRGSMYEAFDQGNFINLPLLIGDDTNEGSYFAPEADTAYEMEVFFKDNYPELNDTQLEQVILAYVVSEPLPDHAAWFSSASAAYGDAAFTCPGLQMAMSAAQHSASENVWNYRFDVQDPDLVAQGLGVPHTMETSAIFGVGYADIDPPASYSTTNSAIVSMVMSYWISFVRSLNPNAFLGPSAPVWGPFGSTVGQRLRIRTNDTFMENVTSHLTTRCSLWRQLADTMEL